MSDSKSKPRPGGCLLCGNREDGFDDLIRHIRTDHSDQTPEVLAALMLRIGDLENKIEGFSSRI